MTLRSERDALILANTLNVDEELQASSGKVTRICKAEGVCCVLDLQASDEKTLRLCLSGFSDFASVAIATLDEFQGGTQLPEKE